MTYAWVDLLTDGLLSIFVVIYSGLRILALLLIVVVVYFTFYAVAWVILRAWRLFGRLLVWSGNWWVGYRRRHPTRSELRDALETADAHVLDLKKKLAASQSWAEWQARHIGDLEMAPSTPPRINASAGRRGKKSVDQRLTLC